MVKYIRYLLLLSCISLIVVMPAQATANGISISINDQMVNIPSGDQQAMILNGRIYVPLKVISENMGANIQWDSSSKRVIIGTPNSGPTELTERTGNSIKNVEIVVDGKVLNIPLDYGTPFVSAMGRTVVPLRAVGEALSCQVNWNNVNKTVEIKKQELHLNPQPTVLNKLFKDLADYKTNLRLLDKRVINSQELLNLSESSFSPEQMEQFQSFYNQLSKYQHQVKLPQGNTINVAELSISGPSVATAAQLRAWMAAETPRIRSKMEQQYNRQFNPIPDLADLYLRIGAEYGIRGDLAFCQAAKETHFWQYTGDVQPYQNNYCGLWATGNPCTGQESHNGSDPSLVSFQAGVHGAIFASPEVGVEAHIQHLYAYANKDPLPSGKVLVDPRYTLVTRGSATTWHALNARWAVPGLTYGQSIIQDYWLNALAK